MIDLKKIIGRPDQFERLLKLVREDQQKARFRRPNAHNHYPLARAVEQKVARIAAGLGYRVWTTTPNSPFDLWVEGCRVEIKASRWQACGRYQAAVRNHAADLVVFDAIYGIDHFFIIPMDQVVPRQTIEVTSYEVAKYSGRWAAYLEAWIWLQQAIERCPRRPIQLTFLGGDYDSQSL